MNAQANIDLVRQGYAAFSAGDVDTLSVVMSPGIVHVVPGGMSPHPSAARSTSRTPSGGVLVVAGCSAYGSSSALPENARNAERIHQRWGDTP